MKSCLVFSVDHNYLENFLVSVDGIFKFSDILKIPPVFVVHDDTIGCAEMELIKNYFSTKKFSNYNFVSDVIFPTSILKISDGDHLTKSTYYRLFIELFIPMDYDSVIYLDTDILIINSIDVLLTFCPVKPIAAVSHYSVAESLRLFHTNSLEYFQAGVLVINYKEWLKYNVLVRSRHILQNENSRILFWDQDILNIIFAQNWEILDNSYNVHNGILNELGMPENIVIIHFDGTNKPWKKFSNRYGKKLWQIYYKDLFNRKHKYDNWYFNFISRLIHFIQKFFR
jgi:lipopolysaccharide biosynthesis glycosyltransferase